MKTTLACLVMAGCLPTFAHGAEDTAPSRPNIVLILADDLGWSDLGCFGGEINTPHLDKLAANGLRFTQFYNTARCCPTRASLLTGLYPHQAGVGAMSDDRGPQYPGYRGTIQPDTVTLAEVLRDAGYSTYMVGKWHLHNQQDVKPTDRGFDEFYGMLGGYNSCWHEHPYYTRWPQGRPARAYTSPRGDQPGSFYATDAFADYALDFVTDARRRGQPFFLYLAFNAPHFPLHAHEEDIARYERMYFEKGWDTIREERFSRQKALGLIPNHLTLPPRSPVPPKSHARPSPYAGKENPPWLSLPVERRRDLARRMAVYAAMVDRLDRAVGRVVEDLREHQQLDNTLLLFLSDNGACWEWDPLGFDETSSPKNILHAGTDLTKVGGPASYISYGSGWANAGNTPWRLYKHFNHEGGIRTPLIVHWPNGFRARGELRDHIGHVMDIMPTLLEVAHGRYPTERNRVKIQPMEGYSLLPAFHNRPVARKAPLFFEHEGSRAVRDGRWKLVSLAGDAWELYDLESDPTEMNNLFQREHAKARELMAAWETWARRCHVNYDIRVPPEAPGSKAPAGAATPQIANRPLRISCEVHTESSDGVILAHGGRQQGYALHLDGGRIVFSVRINGRVFSIKGPPAPRERFLIEAALQTNGLMRLTINGTNSLTGQAPGPIPVQPQDTLSIGEDSQTAVGPYTAPHPLRATITNVRVTTQ